MYINGAAMPTPIEAKITEYDIDAASTGRAESGYLHRERVRADAMMMQAGWTNLTADQANTIRNACAPAQITLKYLFLGAYVEKTVYAGDLNWEPDFTHAGEERWNLSTQFTEY